MSENDLNSLLSLLNLTLFGKNYRQPNLMLIV